MRKLALVLALSGCAQEPIDTSPFWYPEPDCIPCSEYQIVSNVLVANEDPSTTGMLLGFKQGGKCVILVMRNSPDRERTIEHEKKHGACWNHKRGRVEPQ